MATSHLIRIPEVICEQLQALAEESGVPLGVVVQRLVEQGEGRRYWA
ncbi:MAG: hypothetical protein M3176_12440 [Chloroflexota bacterium]|nr:hypothetical protein [Chloroflexota bacterium]MDQ6907628.1 hypothetical protein [Chloroflexota bacterium]